MVSIKPWLLKGYLLDNVVEICEVQNWRVMRAAIQEGRQLLVRRSTISF